MAQHTTSSSTGEGLVNVSLPLEPWAQQPGDQLPEDPLAERVKHCASVAASALEHMAERLRRVAQYPSDFELVVEHLQEPSRAAAASLEGLAQEGMIPAGTQFAACEKWAHMIK